MVKQDISATPPTLAGQLSGRASLAIVGMCLVLLGAYIATFAPGYTFEDTSLFAAACATLGIAHPPGFPLHTITCAPFSWLALWTGFHPAQGAALASAVAAAAACGCLAVLLVRLSGNVAVAVAVAGWYGLTPTFWSQAIIPEVYALNALLVLATLLAADRYASGGGRRNLLAIALLLGLGLANHWPLFVLAGPVIVLWLMPVWRRMVLDLRGKVGLAFLGLILVGLIPYLHLLTPPDASAIFLGAQLPAGFFDYVTRAQFTGFDEAMQHPRWDERWRNATLATFAVLREYSWVGGALAVLGMITVMRKQSSWRVAALIWGVLGTTFMLALFRPFLAEAETSLMTFRHYGLTAAAMLAIPLALVCADWLRRYRYGQLISLGFLVIPLLMGAYNFRSVDRSADDLAMRYAELVQDEIAAESLLLIGHDNMDFPLAYGRFLRTESSAVVVPEVTRLYLDRHGYRPALSRLKTILAREERPVYLSPFVPFELQSLVFHGAYESVIDTVTKTPLALSVQGRDFLRHALFLREAGNNVWTKVFANRIILRFCLMAHLLERWDEITLEPEDIELQADICNSVVGHYAAFLVATLDGAAAGDVDAVAEQVATLGDLSELPIDWQSHVAHISARAQVQAGDLEAARATLEQAVAAFPAATNALVLVTLLQLYVLEGDFQSYAYLRRRYPALEDRALNGLDAQCRSHLGRECTR